MGAHSSVLPITTVLDLAWVQQSSIAQQDLGTPAFPRTELVVRKAQHLDIKPVDITLLPATAVSRQQDVLGVCMGRGGRRRGLWHLCFLGTRLVTLTPLCHEEHL